MYVLLVPYSYAFAGHDCIPMGSVLLCNYGLEVNYKYNYYT